MSKTLLLIAVVAVGLVSVYPVYAQMNEEHEHENNTSMMMEDDMYKGEEMMSDEKNTDGLMEVGNTLCPVSGVEVGQMGDPVQIEYDGKIYNLCCEMCKKSFMENPEKYSAIAESEFEKDE